MSPALANFLFETANFLLLAGVLGWALFKPVRRALDRERERYAKEQAEEKRLREEAETLAKQTRAAHEAAGEEIDQRRRDALEAARREAARIVEDARKEQLAERRVLEGELAARRDAEAAALADAVGRLAAESVRRLLDQLNGPSLDLALVRAACTELEALPAEARSSAVVESARPLGAEARALLGKVLADGFTERVVDELGAGVRVTTAAGEIDATAISLARRAARAMSATEWASSETVEPGHA